MKDFKFDLAHGYNVMFGFVAAENIEEAKEKILNQEYDDIIDEYEVDEFTEGYEIIDIEEC